MHGSTGFIQTTCSYLILAIQSSYGLGQSDHGFKLTYGDPPRRLGSRSTAITLPNPAKKRKKVTLDTVIQPHHAAESCEERKKVTLDTVIQPHHAAESCKERKKVTLDTVIQPHHAAESCKERKKVTLDTVIQPSSHEFKPRKFWYFHDTHRSCNLHMHKEMDGWMNGFLGHFFPLSRLNWAG